jgi:hypothetical protein
VVVKRQVRKTLSAITLAIVWESASFASSNPARPDANEQMKIVADAAIYASNQDRNLPNFLCTQTTQRFVDFTGNTGFRPMDLIVENLSYFDHHENYQVLMVNGQAANITHSQLGGAISSGEFASLLKDIFAPESATTFTWESYYKLRGRLTHVFSYRVSPANSAFHLRAPTQGLDLVIGYHGHIFIDEQDHLVHRITQHADGIPADYPLQDESMILDYEYTRIGDHDYLLPLEFELRLREGRQLVRNDVKYEDYKKFAADTKITFDAPAADKPGKN